MDLGGAHGLRMDILFDLLPLATNVLFASNVVHHNALCLAWTRFVISTEFEDLVCNV